MRALPDVNVPIALLDAAHLRHASARAWLAANIEQGWASCPLTQNGCIRILSQPAYPGSQPPASIAARLAEATGTQWHAFWPDDLSLLEPGCANWRHVLGSRQLTDVYLLALAARRGGRPVTFDRAVPLVRGAVGRQGASGIHPIGARHEAPPRRFRGSASLDPPARYAASLLSSWTLAGMRMPSP